MTDLERLAIIVAVIGSGTVLSLAFAWLHWYDLKDERRKLRERMNMFVRHNRGV